MEFEHRSVLLEETVNGLNVRPDGIYVDGTLGGGGHAAAAGATIPGTMEQARAAVLAAIERVRQG